MLKDLASTTFGSAGVKHAHNACTECNVHGTMTLSRFTQLQDNRVDRVWQRQALCAFALPGLPTPTHMCAGGYFYPRPAHERGGEHTGTLLAHCTPNGAGAGRLCMFILGYKIALDFAASTKKKTRSAHATGTAVGPGLSRPAPPRVCAVEREREHRWLSRATATWPSRPPSARTSLT